MSPRRECTYSTIDQRREEEFRYMIRCLLLSQATTIIHGFIYRIDGTSYYNYIRLFMIHQVSHLI